MNISNVKKKTSNAKKTILINVRITPNLKKWLDKNDFSPTKIFYESVRELGYKDD